MWKMPAKERIQTRIVAASAVKRVLDFQHQPSVCPPHSKIFEETTIGYYAAIILNNRNVAKHLWREPQIIKFENAFHIWINLWLHLQMHTFCNVACQVTLPCASYRLQLTIAILLCCYSFRAVISQNWSAPDSIRYFINGEQNYLFKYI